MYKGNWQQKGDQDYWINLINGYVVRDYYDHVDETDGWVILDDKGMMISCEYSPTKEDCMDEVDHSFMNEGFEFSPTGGNYTVRILKTWDGYEHGVSDRPVRMAQVHRVNDRTGELIKSEKPFDTIIEFKY